MKRKATLSLCRDGHPSIPFEDAAGLAAAFNRYEDAASLRIVGPSPFFDARVSVPRDAAAQLRVMNQFSDRTDPVFHALAMARRGYPIVGAILADDRVEGTPGVDRFI